MWLRWLDRRQRIYYAPSQWEWVRDQVGLTEEECADAAWMVTPAGTTYRGAAAMSVAFDVVLYTGRLFYSIYSLPLLRQFYDWLYVWIGKNRHYFSRLIRYVGVDVTAAVHQDPPWDPL